MKKVLFAIGIIAILVAVPLITMAASPPTSTPSSLCFPVKPINPITPVTLQTLNTKLDALATQVGNINGKVDTLTTQVGNINGKIDTLTTQLASRPIMETISGYADSDYANGGGKIYDSGKFPQLRHVSLTISWTGLWNGVDIANGAHRELVVYSLTGTHDNEIIEGNYTRGFIKADDPDIGHETLEFNALQWYISTADYQCTAPVHVNWDATETYLP